MTYRELVLLNSLVTYAAENIPGGLTPDERDVAQMVGRWAMEGAPVHPVCPHCGSVQPHGDERLQWLRSHLDSQTHRLWWGVKRKLKI